MELLRALVVDDEKKGRENLRTLLRDHCPELQVVGSADSAATARTLVEQLAPDVVFLDINMPKQSGFDFLDCFSERPFDVVFVTAYSQHAVKAIKASAVDYILKPIDLMDLRRAIEKLVDLRRQGQAAQEHYRHDQMQILMENLRSGGSFHRVILHRARGFRIVQVKDILYLKADSNYTTVHLAGGESLIVTGTLKEYEEILPHDSFCRIHKSSLINLLHISEFDSHHGGSAIMSDGSKLPISTRRVKDFLQHVKEFVANANTAL